MTSSISIFVRSLLFLLIFMKLPVFANVTEAPKTPQRIVSCALASDEILLQILPSASDRARLIAVSTLVDDPLFSSVASEARTIPQRTGANIEQVLNLKPDLIFAAAFNQPEFIVQLRKLKKRVHVMEGFQSLADLTRHILDLGVLVKAEKESSALVTRMLARLADLKKNMPVSKSILIIMSDQTLVGKETLIDDGLRELGFRNLVAEMGIAGWQKISDERLMRLKPDFVLTVGDEKDRMAILQTFSKSSALSKIPALQQGKLILIPQALFSSFSPRFLDGLALVQKQVSGLSILHKS